MTSSAYMEVSPLFENRWTGIATVVAALTECALADESTDWKFIYESIELPRTMLDRMLVERNGTLAWADFAGRMWEHKLVPFDVAKRFKAVFTFLKPTRSLFGQEAMVVYDISPILTPQFHNDDTIQYFGNRFRGDVQTSTHFFPISEATRGDLETYFNVPRNASTLLKLGIDVDCVSLSLAQQIARSYQVEPYVAILGTLEPRKNGALVLDYIARNPGFASRFKIVFVGRDGWLDERERLMSIAEDAGVRRDQVIFTGFVSEREKAALLYNAAFCVYASFFEGYGLPILEAAALGKLIVCSNTSSMPEVAPDRCFFFDPSDIFEFARAVGLAEKRSMQLRSSLALSEVEPQLEMNSWEPCYQAVRDWVHA